MAKRNNPTSESPESETPGAAPAPAEAPALPPLFAGVMYIPGGPMSHRHLPALVIGHNAPAGNVALVAFDPQGINGIPLLLRTVAEGDGKAPLTFYRI